MSSIRETFDALDYSCYSSRQAHSSLKLNVVDGVTFYCDPSVFLGSGKSFEEIRLEDYVMAYHTTGYRPHPCSPETVQRESELLQASYASCNSGSVSSNVGVVDSIISPDDIPHTQEFLQPKRPWVPGENLPGTLGRFQSIACMSLYQNFSHEELRYYAYLRGNVEAPSSAPIHMDAFAHVPLHICCQQEFDQHSPEELRIAYLLHGRELTSAEISSAASHDNAQNEETLRLGSGSDGADITTTPPASPSSLNTSYSIVPFSAASYISPPASTSSSDLSHNSIPFSLTPDIRSPVSTLSLDSSLEGILLSYWSRRLFTTTSLSITLYSAPSSLLPETSTWVASLSLSSSLSWISTVPFSEAFNIPPPTSLPVSNSWISTIPASAVSNVSSWTNPAVSLTRTSSTLTISFTRPRY